MNGRAMVERRLNLAVLWLGAIMTFMLLPGRPATAQEAESEAELKVRIQRLVEQLDADTFPAREAAEKALAAIGEPAREALEAATQDDAFERSQRAIKLLRQLPKNQLGLRYLGHVQQPELTGAVTVTVSQDGRFLYVPAFSSSVVNVLRRDANLGSLEHVQSLRDRANTQGVLRVKLSPDESLAASSCIHAKTVILYRRDAREGTLEIADVARNGQGGVVLEWPTDVCFSRDGKHLYAIEPRRGHLLIFAIGEGDKLEHLETTRGRDECFQGARAMAMHPDGETIFVVATTGKLSVLSREADGGKLTVRQILQDERDNVRGLAGVWDVACSSDGKFVYTCSGRNGGDQAVSAFQLQDDGTLAVLEEFVNGEDQLRDFTGGNKIAVSPDGRNVYASGTTSGGLACFRRELQTGRLKFMGTLRDRTTGAEAALGVCGIGFSPDGRFAYLTLESDGAVTIFSRDVERP